MVTRREGRGGLDLRAPGRPELTSSLLPGGPPLLGSAIWLCCGFLCRGVHVLSENSLRCWRIEASEAVLGRDVDVKTA
jgi:hypothetical protein